MTPVFIDYESWWSVDHSLTKMSPIDYVMHPDTEIISCAIKFGHYPTDVIFGEDEIRKMVAKIDWSDKLLIAHNNEGFDSMISAWRFGIKPKMWGCTLAMARPIHAKTAGGSLKKLVEHYTEQLQAMGIAGVKDGTALVNTKGKHLKDFTVDEIISMREYNKNDTEQCAGLFKLLAPLTTKEEARLIDMTIRMLVEPAFEVDEPLLRSSLAAERERKAACLDTLQDQLRVDTPEEVRAMLASSAKFAAFLESRGVPVPMKASPTNPEKQTYALAKTDEEFIALQEHPDDVVAAAACARLDVKSTILETRIEAFIAASNAVGGKLPVPIRYYGADTTGRDSGFIYNPQNMPRVSGKPSDCLRNSLRAPKGMKVIVADLSGIELRVNHFLWQVPSSMALFRADPEKADLYRAFAATMYSIKPEEVSKAQRQYAKACQLGLGFSAGPATFVRVAKMMGGIDLTLDESKGIVAKWRETYYEIVQGWKTCHTALPYIAQGQRFQIDPWGLCHTTPEGIASPRGIIRYPSLRQEVKEDGKTEWCYGENRNKSRIYAGKIDENLVQHLARNVVMGNALEFRKQTGLNTALRVHDELVYVVPEDEAEEKLALLQSIMRTPPTWWPELVVWSEGDIADTYGAAK